MLKDLAVREGLLLDSIPTHSLHQGRKVESQGYETTLFKAIHPISLVRKNYQLLL